MRISLPAHAVKQRSAFDGSTRGTRGDPVHRSPFDKNVIPSVHPLNSNLHLTNVLRKRRPSLRSGREINELTPFDFKRGQFVYAQKKSVSIFLLTL
jgi:hypothetical protein